MVNLPWTKVIAEKVSPVNGRISVVRSLGLGTYLQVEGLTQSGGVVYEVWETTLKKLRNKEIKNCLILGLGGGSAAKLAARFWPKTIITGVDVDPIMIELGKKYLGLDKLKLKIVIGDAEKYLSAISYDLILVDMYVGDKFPKKFESEAFLKQILGLLSGNGVAIFNRLYYGEKRPEAMKFGEKLEGIFSKVEYFYPEANVMLVCSK